MEGQSKTMENKDATAQHNHAKKQRRRRKERIRLIPIWLRLIIIIVLLILSLLAGLMFGYGVIGDGNPVDALKIDTWKHIYDMISGKE